MESIPVNISIHLWVGQEDLGGAVLGNYRQEAGVLKLLNGLGGQDNAAIMLAPGLLRLHDVFANRGIFDEQPRLVQQEQLECGKFVGIANFRGGAMEHVEKKGLWVRGGA